MRMLGTIEGQAKAEKFVSHLLTMDISTHVEAEAGDKDLWDIWIRDEDRIDVAKKELITFLANPTDVRYQDAYKAAQEILLKKSKQSELAAKNIRRGLPRIGPNRGIPPITLTLVILCSVLSLLSNFSKPTNDSLISRLIYKQLSFVDKIAFDESQKDPFVNIRRGEVWRAISPIFLHGDPIHLLLNMILLIQLGRVLETREGSTRYGMLVIVIAILSNLFQGGMPMQGPLPEAFRGTPFFVGISGVVYGLFGYQWIKSSLRPDLLPVFPPMLVIIMLLWLAAGFIGALESIRVANLAHFGGLLAGAGLGWIGQGWDRRIPAKPKTKPNNPS